MTGRREILMLVLGSTLVYALATASDLAERIHPWLRDSERLELDELPFVLLFLCVALAWLARRRGQALEERAGRAERVAHEIRNALGAIRLSAERALKLGGDAASAAQREDCLNDVLGSAERCGRIVDERLGRAPGDGAPE